MSRGKLRSLEKWTLVLAVSQKYWSFQLFQTTVTLERKEIRRNPDNQIDRCLKDPAILFRAFLAYLPSSQSYGGLKKKYIKKIMNINTFETDSSVHLNGTPRKKYNITVIQK